MKNVFKIAILILIITIGCDTPAVIDIKNEFNQTLVFSYSFQQDKKEQQLLKLEIPSRAKRTLSIGFGTRWNDAFLNDYSLNEIDTIYVTINDKTYFCSSNPCKKELFNRIHRTSKRKLSISVNSDLISNSFIEK